MKKSIIGLATAALLTTVPAFAITEPPQVQASSYSKTEMRNFVRNTLAQNNTRGSIVIIKNGQPQQISYGYAWYGKKVGNGNDNVVYPTASLQKVVTAAMIIQLMNENWHTSQKFTQNTKISRWYPNLKNADNITIGQLMTHTSGIQATNTELDRGKVLSENDAINWAIDNTNNGTQGTPGTYFYNNTNYLLLAGIIIKISGQSYENNFNNRIINKLGLANTFLYQDIPSWKTDPISYVWNNGKNYQDAEYVKKTLASQLPGAGNMFTTPMDYYKIQLGLTNGSILGKSDFYYLTHLKSATTNYSGGLHLDDDHTKSAYGSLSNTHFGNWIKMTTDNRYGIIMFLNQVSGDETAQKNIGTKILDHIKPRMFDKDNNQDDQDLINISGN
ncbi:serine hydrolase [Lactobacillus crispatus]|uniref:Serine hydrolase n=2 Tax=Lactobacillus crispatus TaxID=47770 RepID=A0A7H9E6L9_9LACO|nr:serine hydrolase [Lactobacillus crispatus]